MKKVRHCCLGAALRVWSAVYICRTKWDSVPRKDYEGYTVVELRHMLKMRGAKVSGNKEELIDRLNTPKDPLLDGHLFWKIMIWASVIVILPDELCAWGGVLIMGYIWWAMSTSESLSKRYLEEVGAISHKRIFGEYPKK